MENDLGKKPSVSELKIKRIASFLPNHQEINTAIRARIYTGDINGVTWLDSSLDGILCHISDFQMKTLYLVMFDNFTFEKLFQYELYRDSDKKTSICAPGFLALEVDNGFLGFLFEKQEECEGFQGILKKFGSFGQNLFQVRTPENDSLNNNSDKVKGYLNTIKESFITDEMTKYDENFIEDGLEITRSRNIEILGPIYYDSSEGKFQFDELSEELKSIFKMIGIKRKDLEDAELGYSIIKKIILIVSGNEALKEKVFGAQAVHWDRPDPERKIPVKKNKVIEDENVSSNIKTQKKSTHKHANEVPKPPELAIPPPPPISIPLPPPLLNIEVPKKPITNTTTPKPTTAPTEKPPEKAPPKKPELSMEEQLKLAQSRLKKVEKKEVVENIVTTNEKTSLQKVLMDAIQRRRMNLMQNVDENESSSEDED